MELAQDSGVDGVECLGASVFRKTFKRWKDYKLLHCCITDSMLKILGHVVAQLVGTVC